MELQFSNKELAFQQEVRDFISGTLPADIREISDKGQHFAKEHYLRWHSILYEKGWSVPGWPEEHGGPGWTATQKYIFNTEMGLAGMPMPVPFGPVMVGPVIIEFGNHAQKKKYLPRIESGEDWWCQGYSEPGSGSDLASLKTRAVRDGDHYLLNGQKIWTSYAHYADRMFCLVRTDTEVKPQAGISFLLLDMDMPGITVRPIITMNKFHSVNEVFFDNVKVPVENRVGEENMGWTYAKFLLGNERTSIANIGQAKRRMEQIKTAARAELMDGEPLIEDRIFARKIADLEVKLMALEYTQFRLLADEEAGRDVGAVASVLKIRGTELTQAQTEV
ncbi:MAG: acyl-CoA dehydrogenase family protein, partial [Rhodospirillales bacterium]|nr:acyl-CoA dehydrogenase family protein [Rhodospirillales bacterium]